MKRFPPWLAAWLLFCLLPILLIRTGLSAFRQERSRIDWEQLSSSLELWSSRQMQIAGDTKEALRLALEKTGRQMLRSSRGPDPARIRQAMARLSSRFPCRIQWYWTDARGEPIPGLSGERAGGAVLRRLFQTATTLHRDPAEGAVILERSWPVLSAFLGSEAHPRLIPVPGGRSTFGPADIASDRAWFFGMIATGGALFAHLDHPPDFPFLGLKDLLTRLGPRLKKHSWEAGYQAYPGLPTADPDLNLALGQFRLSGAKTRIGSNGIIHLQPLPSGGLLWVKLPRSRLPARDSGPTDLVFGVLLVLLALVSRNVAGSDRGPAISIRWRLLSLFLLATALPLTALIGAGWDYLAQKERLLLTASKGLLERSLREVDGRFPMFTRKFGKRLERSLLASPPPLSGGKALQDWMNSMATRYDMAYLELVDERGFPIGLIRRHQLPNQPEQLIRGLCRDTLATLNNKTIINRSTIAVLWGERSLSAAVMGSLAVWNLLDKPTCMFGYPIPTPGRNPGQASYSASLFALWRLSDLGRMHVLREIEHERRRIPGSWFGVSFADDGQVVPALGRRGQALLRPSIRGLLAGLQAGSDMTALRHGRGAGMHAVGVAASRLQQARLLAVRSDRPVLSEIERWRTGLRAVSLLAIGFAVYLTFLLSAQVLRPLEQLTEGVRALRRHDFKKRLPPGPADEFGDLMKTFNHMLEGLSDLEVGRVVQESLFPREPAVSAHWQAIGRSVPATQVGGDFYDIKPLPDDRLLFLIGDVTGHGVAPGLVMAMVKGLLEHELERKTEPRTLMMVLHRILSQSLPWFYQMSACLGVLDPHDRRGTVLHLVNAGHPAPFLFRAGAAPVQLTSFSLPLGIRHRPRLGETEHPLQPGDTLFLFTDSWFETPARTGRAIGLKRLEETAGALLDADLEASRDRLFAWLEETCGEHAHRDDLTLLLLRIGSLPT